MSNIKELATRVARELSSTRFAVSVVLSDSASPSETVAHMPSVVVPGTMAAIRPALARIMAGAHPGAVAVVTVPATDETATLAAPGGAFDGRALTPPPPVGTGPLSTAGDVRTITKGVRVTPPTRMLLVVTDGTLALRTVGTPETIQTAFAVKAGLQIPVAVLEVGSDSTATVLGLF